MKRFDAGEAWVAPVRGAGRTSEKSGLALVIVLGLLSLMMILGVAFSIFMRTERVAAGNYKNDVRVRHMLDAGVRRAIADVDAYMAASPPLTYPDWLVFPSPSSSVSFLSASADDIIAGEAVDFIPGSLLSAADAVIPHWQDTGSGGRFAYLVFNCSGLIDANFAGGSNRLAGVSPREIQLDMLPEIGSPAAASQLVSERNTHVRYETLQELANVPSGVFGADPQNMMTYSHFPLGPMVYAGGNALSLVSNRTALVQAFVSSGLTAAQADVAFVNLIDYVDSDDIPGNLGNPTSSGDVNGPYVEAVPMVNECMITNWIKFDQIGPTNYSFKGDCIVASECFIPFKSAWSGYRFNCRVLFTNASNSAFLPMMNPINLSQPILASSEYWKLFSMPVPIMGSLSSLPTNSSITMTAEVTAWITSMAGGHCVDGITNTPLRITLSLPGASISTASGVTNRFFGGRQCYDARRNWTELGQWAGYIGSSQHTIGTTNGATLFMLGMLPPPPPPPADWNVKDGDTAMFVKNQVLETAGELGYLFFGSPWETIRLYDHPGSGVRHAVVDNFTCEISGFEKLNGKIHPKTWNSNVLAAVFDDLPTDYPHGIGTNIISGFVVSDAVSAILATNYASTFVNVSDLGRVNWAVIYPAGSELDKESFIRNSCGLFATRQNYFTIIVLAQATELLIMEGGAFTNTSVLAAQRAVAEVWRDPVPDAQGKNQSFLRYFKLLED